jgi:hypothetical protein
MEYTREDANETLTSLSSKKVIEGKRESNQKPHKKPDPPTNIWKSIPSINEN